MKSICVYCGSREGRNPAHRAAADALGRGLARAGIRMVYGAGDLGLMGIAARAAMAEGGKVTGFIPRHLFALEVGKRDLDHLVITETMHERKTLMLGNADAVVALPGGLGTLDELIEVLTWSHLGLHKKPMALVNLEGYWDPLLGLFARMVEEGFAEHATVARLMVVPDPETAINRLCDRIG